MSPTSCARRWLVLSGLLAAFPALVFGQTNYLGANEFPVGGGLPGDQVHPASAFGANGGFAVWDDNATDPFGQGVSAQRLNASLSPMGEVIHVNQTIGGDQARAKVSMLNDGGAAIVFQSGRSGSQNILARFLNASGGFATSEVLVNDAVFKGINKYTTNWTFIRNNHVHIRAQHIREKIAIRHEFNANPVVATLNDGTVVVAYSSSRVYTTNTVALNEQLKFDYKKEIVITNRTRVPVSIRLVCMQDVYVQRFSPTGQKLGGEFRANQFTDFNQRDVSIAALDNGNFVLVWVSEQQRTNILDTAADPIDLYGRIFDAFGNPLTSEFRVNADNRRCGAPTVAARSGGAFTVAWAQKADVRTNGMDIFARTFNSNGNPTSDAFGVNTFTYGDQFVPSIASLGTQQLIIWSSMGQDGSWEGVYARAYEGSTALSDEFRVNLATKFGQMHPHVASDHAGRALVLWSGYTAGASGFDLFGRTYLVP